MFFLKMIPVKNSKFKKRKEEHNLERNQEIFDRLEIISLRQIYDQHIQSAEKNEHHITVPDLIKEFL